MIVGDVGGPRRFNYTAHGAISNAAARLEVANKEFGTAVKTKRFKLRLLGTRQWRGFPAPVALHVGRGKRASATGTDANCPLRDNRAAFLDVV
jgi:class 3 adenylate cyclase